MSRIGAVVLGLASAALVLVVVLVLVLKWAPEWLAQPGLAGNDRAAEVGRTRTAVLATLAGIIALAGAIFTGLSYRLNRAGQITERFTRAIDQLGNSHELDVRLGGIYALERIARDSRDDHPQVVEVLTAYVREHAQCRPNNPGPATSPSGQGQSGKAAKSDEAPRLATDLQAAIDVLARRDVSQDRPNHRLNLAGTDLRSLVLDSKEGGHLEGANLSEAHLEKADLGGAHLEKADLVDAHLEEANLLGATLNEAALVDAHLEAANLWQAHLEGATLWEAHLEGATLFGTHLETADLADAHLEMANLARAHLEKALLGRAHLQRANLREAHLEGANLSEAALNEAHLEGAVYDDETKWPTPGFESEARSRGARHVDDDDERDAAVPTG